MTHEGVRMYDNRPSLKREIESLWSAGKNVAAIVAELHCDARYADYVVKIFASRPTPPEAMVGDHYKHLRFISRSSGGRGFPVLRIEYPPSRRAA